MPSSPVAPSGMMMDRESAYRECSVCNEHKKIFAQGKCKVCWSKDHDNHIFSAHRARRKKKETKVAIAEGAVNCTRCGKHCKPFPGSEKGMCKRCYARGAAGHQKKTRSKEAAVMASPESKAPEEPLPQQQEKGTLVDIAKPRHMKLGKAAKGRESSLDLWRSGALTYGNNSKQKKKKAPGAAAASPLELEICKKCKLGSHEIFDDGLCRPCWRKKYGTFGEHHPRHRGHGPVEEMYSPEEQEAALRIQKHQRGKNVRESFHSEQGDYVREMEDIENSLAGRMCISCLVCPVLAWQTSCCCLWQMNHGEESGLQGCCYPCRAIGRCCNCGEESSLCYSLKKCLCYPCVKCGECLFEGFSCIKSCLFKCLSCIICPCVVCEKIFCPPGLEEAWTNGTCCITFVEKGLCYLCNNCLENCCATVAEDCIDHFCFDKIHNKEVAMPSSRYQ